MYMYIHVHPLYRLHRTASPHHRSALPLDPISLPPFLDLVSCARPILFRRIAAHAHSRCSVYTPCGFKGWGDQCLTSGGFPVKKSICPLQHGSLSSNDGTSYEFTAHQPIVPHAESLSCFPIRERGGKSSINCVHGEDARGISVLHYFQ